MPQGSGAKKRAHADAIRAAKLKARGWTTRNIAETIGKQPKQIKALVLLGERLMSAQPEPRDER